MSNVVEKEVKQEAVYLRRTWMTPFIKLFFAMIAAPFITYYCEKIVMDSERFSEWFLSDTGDFAHWVTSVTVFFVIAALSLLTTKLSVSTALTSAAMIVMHQVHYIKMNLRGEPFFPWDIFQYKEAINISGDVELEFTDAFFAAVRVAVILTLVAVVIDVLFRYPKSAPYPIRVSTAFAVFGCMYMFVTGVVWNTALAREHGIELVLFEEVNSYENGGFFITFMQNAEKMVVTPPEDYTESKITTISDGYEASDGRTPNIICIMSEAYINPEEFTNIEFDRPTSENINYLSENYLSGRLLTPSYGGGTSISEYEVLTSNAAAYLPSGTVPYMQFVRTKSPSYAAFLKELGYSTLAIHPYTSDFWCRNKAYPLLGFDRFLSMDDFTDSVYPRDRYISDMDLTKKIISEFEGSEAGVPFFAFCVSMQNHAGYQPGEYGEDTIGFAASEDGSSDEVYADLTEWQTGLLQTYATGAALADEALGELIDYFSRVDEDTVIVFFGDHQPYLGETDLDLIGLMSPDNSDAENSKILYSTPYIIWNNFGAGGDAAADMSMYQLLPYMTEKLGLARPAYYNYLSDARETMAGHISWLSLGGDGTPTYAMDSAMEAAAHDHWLLEYDIMFGKRYARSIWSISDK